MKLWKHKLTVTSLAACFGLAAGTAAADDIEIYAGAGSTITTYLPNVMFVIDTSGSMDNKDGTSTTRLYKVQEALKEVLSASTDVNVGLMRFSNPGGPVLFPIANIDSPVSPDERISIRLDDNDGSEDSGGFVDLDSSAISLGDGATHGFRFEDVRIPQGASITSAQLVFAAYEDSASEVTFNISAELAADSAEFEEQVDNFSNRTKTTAELDVTEVASWQANQFTSNLDVSSMVQEVVDQDGWCGGQALSMFVRATSGSGLGVRRVHSHESNPALTASLRISYDYNSASGCMAGSHANQIYSQADNVEETKYGYNSTGSVLNMDTDTNSAIGLRFDNVEIPQGATIEQAYLTFTPYANRDGSSSLTIHVEDADNASPYTSDRYTVTSRDYGASQYWPIGSNTWRSNQAMQSADISSLVSSVVSRGGWQSGNALAFKVVPSNKEVKAYTYHGNASKSVRLYVKYRGSAQASSFTVRQHMQTLVDGLTHDGWTPVAETLYEAYRYYNGGNVLYGLTRGVDSGTKPLTRVSHEDSYFGAPSVLPSGCYESNLSDSDCAGEYIPTTPTATYISPIEHVCQQNHIVLLTDGRANQTRSTVRSYINGLTGRTCSASTSGNLNDENCGVHLAQYNASSDKPGNSNDARIFTHTISFVPDGTGTPDWLTYLQDMATVGGGDFYPTSDVSSIADAFQRIISDAKKRNTTFVAPSVAISDVNKLLHDSHVYYAVFSPKDTQNWPGNLKKYKIANGLVLSKSGSSAVDSATGFFETAAQDFWSSATTGNDEVTVGGARESNENLVNRKVFSDIDGFSQISSETDLITEDILGITARSDAESRRLTLINWLKGLDDNGDPDYQIGDPLHSEPVVLRRNSGNDEIFFGTNQGYIHAIDTETGNELWSFIPQELLKNANDYYENSVFVTRVYGMDGPMTLVNTGEKNILIAGMRRGGESYYALDVSGSTPAKGWSNIITNQSTGAYSRLGQTWSKMIPATVKFGGSARNVLFFGGGYDPAHDSKTIRQPDAVGNAIYMVDAATGALLWYASNSNLDDGSSYTVIDDMDYAVAADVYVLDRDRDGYSDHIYAVDLGGQVIRLDIHNGLSGTEFISGGVVADVGGSNQANNRRFFYQPDVAYVNDAFGKYFAVAVGSGYRAHPLDLNTSDKFFVIRDYGVFDSSSSDLSGTTKISYGFNKVDFDGLLNATSITEAGDVSELNDSDFSKYEKGFYIDLAVTGEKALSSPVIVDYKVAFSTYLPGDPTLNPNQCTPPEGNGRAYVISLGYGRPVGDFDDDNNTTESDRYMNLTHGGIPSSPKIIYAEQDLPVICVSSECTNASTMYDSDGNLITDSNAQGNAPNILNALLPPTNQVYRDTNWQSGKERVPNEE
ncbi:PQQ-binding-like beta-propeller repeat protein [Neiella sp. HB171785]|uniref:PQQ-binding-like beta-propeller repeat protein n=1 Tax=Neiella litorisoli TaxID=2771431 RepID=A0A8J6UDZ0_9GAMM|nr:VWA domain-containing protein [Neiella litorisoli]MBD1388889.1 PQQ-binding-like beta-propeller repeat protein [Neiella litorisoli]